MGNNTPKRGPPLILIPLYIEPQEDKNTILFLGTADSGKSTLFNQFQLIDNSIPQGITEVYQRSIVFNRLLNILVNDFNLFNNDSQPLDKDKFIQDIIDNKISFEDLFNKNKDKFTKENLFTKLKETINQLNSQDNIEYLLNNLERILIKNEITELDFLSSYCKTTGIIEYKSKINNNTIVTAGGIRNERRKWIHIFNEVSTLVIFVSLSEFNQTCFEDLTTNRLKESLQTFKELFNSKWFISCNILLIFTKVDCFIKKINSGILFSLYFNEFTGNNYNPKEVFEFIVKKFKELCENKKELKYCALNCLDKFECRKVKEIIENIKDKYQNELFINKQLLMSGRDLNQMFIKLFQSLENLNYCDIQLFTIEY